MKTTSLQAGIYCLLGIAGVSLTAGASRAEDASALTKVVRYEDLNIQTQAGAQTLYRRIRAAAEAVCPVPGDAGHLVKQRACIDHAIDQAVLKVNSTVLTRLRFGADFRLASK